MSNVLQLVGDYTNPILKPEAAATVKKFGEMSIDHFGFPNPRNQCWPNGVPFVLSSNGMQMFQQPDKITMIYQTDHQVRHVRMNAQHPAKVTPSWYGDSVGHYEGDTLVIDTVGIKAGPFAMVDWFGTPQTPALHVVERYRLLDYEAAKEGLERDAKENALPQPPTVDLNYRGKHLQLIFTVEDPNVFTTPWSATVTYGKPAVEWAEKSAPKTRTNTAPKRTRRSRPRTSRISENDTRRTPMMDQIRRNILATGAAAAAVAAAPGVFAQQAGARSRRPSTKKAPFASTMRRPVPAFRCCSSPAAD